MIKRKITPSDKELQEYKTNTDIAILQTSLFNERRDVAKMLDALVVSSGSSVRITFSRSANLCSAEYARQKAEADGTLKYKDETITIRMQLIINQSLTENPVNVSETRADITRYTSIVHPYHLSRLRRLLLRLVLPNRFPRNISFSLGPDFAAERTIQFPAGKKNMADAIESCIYELIQRVEQW